MPFGLGKKKKSREQDSQGPSNGRSSPPRGGMPAPGRQQPPTNGHRGGGSSRGPSRTQMSICGLPVTVWGLQELTTSSEVCISIHMHGRGGSAENEEHICKGIWTSAMETKQRSAGQIGMSSRTRELLVIGFDARNHGHRMTDELAQKGWGVGNEKHAMDLYAMIVGTAADTSHLVSFLPPYLFPNDEHLVTRWCVTGKSLGGHAVWHVLKDDPRISVGVPMIGMPDYSRLLEFRTKQSDRQNAAPTVPNSLKALIKSIDPAQSKYDRWGAENPYWGKKILTLNGAQDKLVHPSFSQHFLSRLLVSEPTGQGGEQEGFRQRWLDGVKHTVTEEMVQEAGAWIGTWGLCRA